MSNKLKEPVIQAWIELHRAHRRLLEQVESRLKAADLPPLAWYDVLLELQREKQNGLRQYEIGEKILLSKHNLSRLIDRLEQQELVQRLACAEDGRGYNITITQAGAKLLKTMWLEYGEFIQTHFGNKLNQNELTQLTRILSKINED